MERPPGALVVVMRRSADIDVTPAEKVPDPSDPAVINIKVTTETEGDTALECHGKETDISVDTV